MTKLSVHLLGPLQVTLGDAPITDFATDKARALLAYLVVESDRPHRRDALAGLLWPDQSQKNARQNLRQTLARQARGVDADELPTVCLPEEQPAAGEGLERARL